MKNQLETQQSTFTKPHIGPTAATEASFSICFLLAQHKKSFSDGELVTKAFIEGGEILLFKNRSQYAMAIDVNKKNHFSLTNQPK